MLPTHSILARVSALGATSLAFVAGCSHPVRTISLASSGDTRITDLAISDKAIAVAGVGWIALYDLMPPVQRRVSLQGFRGAILTPAFDVKGGNLYFWNGFVYRHDGNGHTQKLGQFSHLMPIALAPDGSCVLEDGASLVLTFLSTGTQKLLWPDPMVACANSSLTVIAAAGDKTLREWRRKGNGVTESFRMDLPSGTWSRVTSMAISPDGYTAIVGTSEGLIVALRTDTGRVLWSDKFFADCYRLFLPTNNIAVALYASELRVIGVDSGKSLRTTSLAASTDGTASCTSDAVAIAEGRKVQVFDLATLKELLFFEPTSE